MDFRILPVTPFQQNCTLFWCTKTRHAAIIDPGGDIETIDAAIRELSLTPERILLTHGHIDHVGATAEVAQRYDIPIIGPHADDAFLIEGLAFQSQMFGFPSVTGFRPDRWLQQGDEVEVGEIRLEVLHCPGHTPGHVVFFNREAQIAQVGDVLFQGSIGRTDFPRGNHADLIASIRQRLFPLGDDVRFVPGHGPMSTLGAERRSNPFVRD
ncbi:MBL fold metallo-hydrolase [Thiorhodococcus mannitoliphagus]|uniref:MBL fold metallo-hydrolase n=1 Tax=Thiorhodococcus mannitoliphagus TaxID=329406 RepID=A0A6P1E592_9GAMM|nr:MBL fold metallo-hydrolase [Thiorhodococcus mannitoliphagus]